MPRLLVVLVMTASTSIVSALSTTGSATNTYFFGSGGGKDTINFGGSYEFRLQSFHCVHVAVDSTYGATSGYSFVSSTGKLSFGNDSNFLTFRCYWYFC